MNKNLDTILLVFEIFLLGGAGFCPSAYGYLAQLAARLPLEGTPSPPGSLWPLPKSWEKSSAVVAIASKESFSYQSNVNDCNILNEALERYSWDFLFRDSVVTPGNTLPILSTIQVDIATDPKLNLCPTFPQLDANDPLYEAYNLSVSVEEGEGKAKIIAKTVWGALRGIETFSQLIWKDENSNEHLVNVTDIKDSPRFPHRGVMIDTARHFIGVNIIRQILDAMSYNKFNVLHWHIVDDQSFPFVSTTFPELSQKGAYLPELIYEPNEVKSLIAYARNRGIRVVLEFDTPGHTQGFGKAFPQLLTPCYGDGTPGTPNYPTHAAYEILDPTKENTYTFMTNFFREVHTDVSEDNYIHLGMDEVYYACWESSPEIQAFMRENNYTKMSEVQQHYTEKHLKNVKDLGARPIIWHDPIEFGVKPDKDVLIQVWKGDATDPWQPYMKRVLEGGYNAILSSCWYLNYINYGESWKEYYECDPVHSIENITTEEGQLILGGEANLWSEYIDATNILQRLFPFSSAVAERLWSPYNSSSTADAKHRLDEHRCRLLWRGVPAQPIYNSYCLAAERSGIIPPYIPSELPTPTTNELPTPTTSELTTPTTSELPTPTTTESGSGNSKSLYYILAISIFMSSYVFVH